MRSDRSKADCRDTINTSLLYRGMMDEEGNQFVAYFLPNEDTLRKRKRDCDEGMDYMPEDL